MTVLEVLIKTSGAGNVKELSNGFNSVSQSLLGINAASLTTGALMGAMAAELKRSIDAAGEAELVNVRLTNALKNTGGAITYTIGEVDTLAASFSRMSGIDDEVIAGAMSMMLRFKNLSDETFPRTMQAALDLSAAMEIDLTSAVKMLGRAMENPEQGMIQLRRAGVQLDENQQALVKSFLAAGDVAGAQNVILSNLEDRYKGAAREAGDTYVGALNKLRTEFGNLEENIGGVFIPILAEASGALNTLLFGNKTVLDTLNLHGSQVLRTADSYATYSTELKRAAEATGYYVNSAGDLMQKSAQQEETMDEWGVTMPAIADTLIAKNYMLTASAYDVARAKIEQAAAIKGVVLSEDEAAQETEKLLNEQKKMEEQIRKVAEAATDAALSIADMGKSYKGTSQKQREGMLLGGIRDAMRAGGASDQELVDITEKGNVKFGLATKESQNLAKIQGEVTKELQNGSKYTGDMLGFIEKLSAASTVLAQNQLWEKFKSTEVTTEATAMPGGFGYSMGGVNGFGMAPAATGQEVPGQSGGPTADTGIASVNTALAETDRHVSNIADETKRIETNFQSLADNLKGILEKINKELTDANIIMQKNFFKPVNDGLKLASETIENILKNAKELKEWADKNIITIRIKYVYDGSAPGIPGKALGGDVAGGMPHIVGEKGPELFVPPSSGKIIPNNKVADYLGNSGSVDAGGQKVVNVGPVYFEYRETVLDEEQLKAAWGRLVALG